MMNSNPIWIKKASAITLVLALLLPLPLLADDDLILENYLRSYMPKEGPIDGVEQWYKKIQSISNKNLKKCFTAHIFERTMNHDVGFYSQFSEKKKAARTFLDKRFGAWDDADLGSISKRRKEAASEITALLEEVDPSGVARMAGAGSIPAAYCMSYYYTSNGSPVIDLKAGYRWLKRIENSNIPLVSLNLELRDSLTACIPSDREEKTSASSSDATIAFHRMLPVGDAISEPKAIEITGKISDGDYNCLRVLISYISFYGDEYESHPWVLVLNSNGGDLQESIKIGNLASALFLRGTVGSKHTCMSSCFFILLGTVERLAYGVVGVHRPYYGKEYFSSLGPKEAEAAYKKAKGVADDYLSEKGASKWVIDKMMSHSSHDIFLLRGNNSFHDEAENELLGMPIFMQEYVIAKCGKNPLHGVTLDSLPNFEVSEKYSKCMYKAIRSGYHEAIWADEFLSEKTTISTHDREVSYDRMSNVLRKIL